MHITLISGGFPCQDVSDAGLRAGINGSRSSLVYEQIRLLQDIRPDYAVFENVAGLRRRGLREVLGEIAKVGYDAEWYSLWAEGFGAPHPRERVFILVHSDKVRRWMPEPEWERIQRENQTCFETWKRDRNATIANLDMQRLQGCDYCQDFKWESEKGTGLRDAMSWYDAATEFCGVAHGLSDRMDRKARIECLGNAVVPQQVYPILKAISDIERGVI
jgi:DNA (cytosine-5)-methyltransferase 1